MSRRTKLRVAMLLLLVVTAIFASPAVDLQPTALRALQLANLFFAALALAGTACATGFYITVQFFDPPPGWHPTLARTADRLELNCSRLC
ncbi:MAG TPA: hypothetical protein VMG31_15775 [Verrucomicrobiae bacterium]|nr:hypothetical protein [Verrucomicrobiae bacterium]